MPTVRDRVLRRRLATQRLTSAPLATAADVVRLLLGVQSQERDHAMSSLGMRSRADTYDAVLAELDSGAIIRTHVLRPTWHFVAAEDLRWLLALTAPRVEQISLSTMRGLGVADDRVQGAFLDDVTALLAGGKALTRKEIVTALSGRAGYPTDGMAWGYLLFVAEMRAVVCSGPQHGVHHTYGLVDELVPRRPDDVVDRDEALVRLARRFFAGHGPASVRDLARWATLTLTDCRRAVDAALGEHAGSLEQVEVDGEALWFDPSVPARTSRDPGAFLFPAYDEAVLTYPQVNFPALADHPHSEHPDPFWAWVVADGQNVGMWKRTVEASTVVVETRLAPSLGRDQREAVERAAQRLADFLERDLDHRTGAEKPHLWGGEAGHPARRPRPSRGRAGDPAG